MKTDFYKQSMFFGADAKTFRIAATLRRDMTLAERILWKRLSDRKNFNVKFRRQHPINIFIVDFYCHEFKLVIEVDGEVHISKESMEYDLNRTAVPYKFGIKVIRFSNEEVIFNIDSVINKIHKMITGFTTL